jgi:O-antigen/teichoic acid export membrane protein
LNLLKNYIQSFISKSGFAIFSASIAARMLSLFASWIALQLIPNKELGIVLFAYNIIIFIIPIGGFGLHQSLIRYGSLLKTETEKNSLFVYAFKKGILATVLLILLVVLIALFIPFHFENTNYYVAGLSLILIPNFLFELIKIQFRLQHNNKKFAQTEIIYSLILILFITIFSYLYQEIGYALALLLSPTLAVLFFIKKLNINFSKTVTLHIIDIQFWKYGVFASLSNVVTQLLFVIDIFLIGYLMNNSEMVTIYKYISLIPLSLLFLPRVFINTDFVTFTENIHNKEYIINYIKSYMLLFSLMSILIIFFFLMFSIPILNLFEPNFEIYNDSFLILIFGVCGVLIFRGLFGNLLSSIGKAHVNFYITSFALIINVISNYYLIPEFGIKGAAITSASLMWVTGICSVILFWQLYNKRFLSK